ncbi:MAG: Gfo/Idh/MocA family oxidoreductase [Ruminococcaceae bacterium]|nr:Gfo/Idh/MocA family oxidoreductase [Oscillospiraceae bacterium]
MRRIKIAHIGMNRNSHSSAVFATLVKQPVNYEVVGYVLPEGERETLTHRLGCFEGYPELTLQQVLEDDTIEAVTIETDEVHLTKYAQMAASHGKHIHMEKPGGASLPAFEKLIDTMRQSGKVFHTGYMYRYNPMIRELIEQCRRGELGDIISVEAQMSCPHPYDVRQWLEALPGGMMFFLGCHLVDMVLRMQGQPKAVYPFNRSTGVEGVTAPDYGMAVLEYDRGVSLIRTCAAEKGGFARRQLVVTGTQKTVELKPLEWYVPGGMLVAESMTYDTTNWYEPGEHAVMEPVDRYMGMMEAFAAMVRGEMENPYTLDYELSLFKLVLRCCGDECDG